LTPERVLALPRTRRLNPDLDRTAWASSTSPSSRSSRQPAPLVAGDRSRYSLPALAEQKITYSTTTQSAAFNAKTRMVRIHTDSICSIEFGTNPTATTSTGRMAAGATEYHGVPVGQNYMVAVITNT